MAAEPRYACLYCGSPLENPSVAHAQRAKRQVERSVWEWQLAEARWHAEEQVRYAWTGNRASRPFPWEVAAWLDAEADEVDT